MSPDFDFFEWASCVDTGFFWKPEHTLANECSGVQLGLAAAEVTVGVIEMCAAA